MSEVNYNDRIIRVPVFSEKGEDATLSDELRKAVTNIIIELGVPANVNGYFYLREAILYKVNNPDNLLSLTKILYPHIAKQFSTTPARVERAIRHAIKVAWTRGDSESQQKYFSYSVINGKKKPTNSQFIATIVDRLKLTYM